MAIACPYCNNALGIRQPKPGRFTPKCPKCDRPFLLLVPEDPAGEPSVMPIEAKSAGGAGGTPAGATQPAPTGVRATRPAPPPAPDATGAWSSAPPGPAATVADGRSAAALGATAAGAPGATAVASAVLETAAGPAAGPAPASALGDTEVATVAAPASVSSDTDARFELASGVENAPAAPPSGRPTTLGGYQIVEELGRGGMGAVFLARQLSLDRNVALKVMRPEWASDPTFVSRFTREAYAAAQLTHHNVVQIYDFGEDKGTNFFSMEFVRGQTLSALLKDKKKLDPEVAVGYILQAARGLKYAHDQRMIHRDIKPDNLLVNDQGIVKVADLGLVKTPSMVEAEVKAEKTVPDAPPPRGVSGADSGVPITIANVAMGTPAFMAPEQARDAASVDARADIYSLGCTLYDLVTGRPPFEGRTALEVMTKHQSEQPVPPERLAKRVPRTLSDIISKMMAKRPEDRHAHLGEVIRAFEEYLGISSAGPFSPREEHANLLLECVEAFHASPTARLRPKLVLGSAAANVAAVLLALLLRKPLVAGGLVGLGVMSALSYFVLAGVTRKTHSFQKVREYIFGSRPADWAMALAGLLLFGVAMVGLHLVWAWLAFSVVAVLLACGLVYGLDRKVEAERAGSLERVEQMLRSMRLQGLEEDALRQFVCKYGGEGWEEFYEDLFGYEAKRQARDLWGRGERGRLRKTHAAWRDPLLDWVDAKQAARRAARETKVLQRIEERSLEAQGENLVVARRKAQRTAAAMVAIAGEMKEAARNPTQVIARPALADAMKQATQKPEEVLAGRERGLIRTLSDGPLGYILGARPRFVVGTALVAGCLMWMDQNGMISHEKIREAAAQAKEVANKAVQEKNVSAVGALRETVGTGVITTGGPTRPLELSFLPRPVSRLFNDFSPGVAGLILVISSFFSGSRLAMFALAGAAVALFGTTLGIPSAAGSRIAGAVLGGLGLVFGRGRR